jgi:HlyD family secretion protein
MKKLLIVLLLAALGAGGWYYFSGSKGEAPQYQTAPIVRGDLIQAVTATGTLNPVLNVQVGSQVSGIIQKLHVDFNSVVKAGEVIAELDPATYLAGVHQAEGELASAEAGLNLARLNAKRQEELTQNKIAAQSELDTARAALLQAEAAVKIKTAQLERSRVDLGRCKIYAPIDGVVISRSVDVGQTVAASLQAPVIFTIANDLRNMQINANVAEADVGNIEAGQPVDFTVDAFPNRTFRGKVGQVRNAPITVQNVVTYDTVIAVENEDMKLKPGMTANVSVIVAQRQGILKLPSAALRYRPADAAKPAAGAGGGARPQRPAGGGGSGPRRERPPGGERTVYVLANGTPQPVPVKVGITDGIFTEMLEGLKETDLLVTGMANPQPAAAGPSGASPLGGGGRRF